MVAQMIVRSWAMPAELKFLVVMTLVTPILLLSYRYCVRFTAIGSLLNGPCHRTEEGAHEVAHGSSRRNQVG